MNKIPSSRCGPCWRPYRYSYFKKVIPLARGLVIILTVLALVPNSYSQTKEPFRPKTSGAALRYSLTATLVPPALGTAVILIREDKTDNWKRSCILFGSCGLIFGPSMGHIYAGRDKPLTGSFIRLGAAALGTLGFSLAISDLNVMGTSRQGSSSGFGALFIILGSGTYLASVIYDFVTLDEAVEKYNARQGNTKLSIEPWLPEAGKTVGVKLSLNL